MAGRRALIVGLALIAAGIVGMSAQSGGGVSWGMHGGGMMGPMMGWWGSTTGNSSLADPIEGAPEVRVEAFDLGFEPGRPVVTTDGAFNLTLMNRGSVLHDLTIPALDVRLVAGPGETVTSGLSDVAPGSYDFSCTVPGHAAAGMVGVLVIESGS